MLGRKYQDAYTILEKSFHSQSSLNKPDSSTGERLASNELGMGPAPFRYPTADRLDTLQPPKQNDRHADVSTLQPPARLDPGLPPTPPSNIQEAPQETENNAPAHADGVVSSLMSQKSGLNTPINQRSPPTPETTPPQNRDYLSVSRPSLVSHTPSSFAGSFRTAREQQSIDDGESYHYVPSEASTHSFSGAWSHSTGCRPGGPVPEIGLGLNFEYMAGEGTSAESTPGERYPEARDIEHDMQHAEISRHTSQQRNGDTQDLEWDDDRMRNVTVRKRQPRPTVTTSPKPDLSTPENASPSLRDQEKRRSTQDGRGIRSPSMKKPARDGSWSSPVHDPIQVQPQREDQKRLSSASNTSTVVEAVVFSSPTPYRPQHRALRRMGKNVSLRDRDRSTESDSTRNSQASGAMSPYRLINEKSPVSERKSRDGNGSVVSSRAVSGPERLPSDSVPIMEFPQPPSAPKSLEPSIGIRNTGPRLQPLPPGLDRVGLGYFDIAQRRAPFASGPPHKNERRSRHSVPAIKRPTMNDDSGSSNDQDPPVPSKSATRETSQQQLSTPENVRQPQMSDYPQNGWQRNEFDEDLLSDEPGLPIMGTRLDSKPISKRGRRSTSLDNSPNLRAQSDHPRASRETTPMTRSSGDYLLAPNSDHSLALHVHASASPHSEGSTEQPDTVEVSQATAVSIYPHNNNSLLVVQQLARPATSDVIERRRTISSIRSGASTSHTRAQSQPVPSFTATIVPSTPPMNARATPNSTKSGSQNRSPQHLSPLQTRGLDPKPPAFKIIPPTPLSEIESPFSLNNPNASTKVAQLTGPGVPTNAAHAIQNPPSRRLSLRQRARRLSEPIIQPLLHAKAQLPLPVNKNRHNLHIHPPSVPSVSDIPQENNKLHPFWRPRGFWDDFSDSDDDDEFFDDEEDEGEPGFLVAGRHATSHAHVSPFTPYDPDLDRLPAGGGGDTSHIRSPLPPPPLPPPSTTGHLLGFAGGSLSRRIGSLRSGFAGAGGFLIGNSLGIGRQPSNSRRHVVQIPGSLRAGLASSSHGVQKRRRRRGPGGGGVGSSAGSVPDGGLRAPGLRRRMQQQKQQGLLQRARLGVKSKRSSLDRVFMGHRRGNAEEAAKLGFRVPNGFDGVRETFVGFKKERNRRRLKKSIGKIELVHDGRTARAE